MSTPALSTRGTKSSVNYHKDYAIWDIISNLWHPESNPDGYVSLDLAENALMHEELRDFLNSKKLVDPQAAGFTYGSGPYGSKNVRAAIASFVNHHFEPAKKLLPDQIFVANGVTAAIEHCSWGLANPGDGILLGRPYYRAFLHDISSRTDVNVVPVAFGDVDPCGIDCVSEYEKTLLISRDEGIPIRALMLCHPHNPLGRCYSRDTLIALLRLCQTYKIHLISDEIYALTIWKNTVDKTGPAPVPFESVLFIDPSDIIDPSLVHVLCGISKDFGANGLRLGAIVSPANPAFIQACRASGLFSAPSSLVENAVVQILSDAAYVKSYIRLNKKRLSAAYTHAITELRKHGIEHVPGVNAAFFVWINLGTLFKINIAGSTSQDHDVGITARVRERLMAKKVYLVDGDAAGAEQPGWFRLVFTQPAELVSEAIGRIAAALK
ncbi:catalytic [Ascochyta rabiei]|uniref:Catalytic n=1 Tax=Didymella rabiei TaxID=5454 RepID=A0A163KYL1_DIDRA|nr:catalytic [Ascochyta rabiei]